MTDNGNLIIRKTITMRLKDEELVRRVMKNYGLDFSSAIRFIVNDWANDLSNVYWRDGEEVKLILSD
jgi:antitoxin component of RelBE/YafQ-DinJ toxin-antitoxin module